jgi:hypothetical protein
MNQPMSPENTAEFTQVFQVSAILYAHEKFQDPANHAGARDEELFLKTFMRVKGLRSRCLSEFRQTKPDGG